MYALLQPRIHDSMRSMMDNDYAARTELFGRHTNRAYVQFIKRMGFEINVKTAQGALVFGVDGKRYIDCIAGYGNCVLGHNDPTVTNAVIDELRSPRPYNLPFIHEVQTQLARTLVEMAPGELECCFFVNSGSEAVETALKLARLSTGKPGVVCMRGAWHGFTAGCMSVSEPSMWKTFAPLLDQVTHVPYNDAPAVEAAINERVGCVIVEPIQAENGAIVPAPGYLKSLEEVCKRRGILLLVDEVKTGIAKTGKLFACQHDNVVPDILITGKALGGGVMPIGGVVAKRDVWSKFGLSFPMSSSSGAGNAPACAAALATLRAVEAEKLCEHASRKGELLRAGLRDLVTGFPQIILKVSGVGLLLGLHVTSMKCASDIVARCAGEGVLVMNAFCDRTKILIEPPAVIATEDIGEVIRVLTRAVAACANA